MQIMSEHLTEYCVDHGFPIARLDLLQCRFCRMSDISHLPIGSAAENAASIGLFGKLRTLAAGFLSCKQVERAKPWESDAGYTQRISGQCPLVSLSSSSIIPRDRNSFCYVIALCSGSCACCPSLKQLSCCVSCPAHVPLPMTAFPHMQAIQMRQKPSL